MIDFTLNDEQRLLEQSVREWGGARSRAVHPRARSPASLRSRPHPRRHGDARPAGRLGAAGVRRRGHGLHLPRAASEELEYVDTSLRVIMSVHVGLNCLTLLAWGTEDQKRRYLVPQAQGTKIASYGLTEPGAGSDARAIQTTAVTQGRSLLPVRREDLDLARRRRGQLPRHRLDRSREEEAARSVRPQRVHRRARVQGVLERPDEGEVGHPRGQHRLLQDGRRRGARGERARQAGRGLQDCDVRARSGPLHRGRGRDRPHPRVPRRQREVRARNARPSASRSASTSS